MSFPGLSPESLARLEAQLQADLDAVRRVRALLTPAKDAAHGSPASPPPPVPLPAPGETGAATPLGALPAPTATATGMPPTFVPPPNVAVAVPQAVAGMHGEFSLRDVNDMLRQKHLGGHEDREIRSVLNKMVKSGALCVAKVGRGRGGSTYQRVAQG